MKNIGIIVGGILFIVSIILVVYFVALPSWPVLTCGNGVCEIGETPQNCPQDCTITPPDADVLYLNTDHTIVARGWTFDINTKIKNKGSETTTFMVEGAMIPVGVAQQWGLLSIFPMSTIGGQCCSGQYNFRDEWVVVDGFSESDEIVLTITAPEDGIQDYCNAGVDYYDGCVGWLGKEYVLYVIVANHCNYKEGVQQSGYVQYDEIVKKIKLSCF